MTSGRLDLTDNTTCYLTNSGLDIQFYTVNLTNLGRNTSIESFLRTPDLLNNMIAAHKSDILRYLMLYKFGGIYLDLDFVTLNSLTHYQNIVVTEPNPEPGDMVC